jgi:hypothetical protein
MTIIIVYMVRESKGIIGKWLNVEKAARKGMIYKRLTVTKN